MTVAKKKIHLTGMQRYGELLFVLAQREIDVRYRGSFLGVYWSLFNPLIMTGLYTTIFGALFKQYYQDSVWQYVLAAFTGLAIVHFYQGSTSQALRSVVDNGLLLNKIKLPVSVFPIATILANTFQLLTGMLPILGAIAIILHPQPLIIINTIAIIIPAIALIIFCTGVGLLVSALYVFFRDLPFFYELVTFILWLGTPVFYPAEIVSPKIRPILEINPLYPIVESLRQIVLSGDLPDPVWMLRALLSSSIVLAIGWPVFAWLRPKFMDLL
jgi:ABC-type polysaccharide/polyol phosphate export permease